MFVQLFLNNNLDFFSLFFLDCIWSQFHILLQCLLYFNASSCPWNFRPGNSVYLFSRYFKVHFSSSYNKYMPNSNFLFFSLFLFRMLMIEIPFIFPNSIRRVIKIYFSTKKNFWNLWLTECVRLSHYFSYHMDHFIRV